MAGVVRRDWIAGWARRPRPRPPAVQAFDEETLLFLRGVARQIRLVRERRGWGREALAVAAGLTPEVVEMLEAGGEQGRTADLDQLSRVAEALGVPFGALIPEGPERLLGHGDVW